ncbi:sensor histidine kinase [Actinophytocola xinjiangensis]|uniref:sensor histidine kinase n=1 Tax=Actinophytocola xinjiangensis TaxID=485602 RepID=UPI00138FBC74|nr:nitrate- and nitrite sensing domain-containing protein [Actinophytocola xinjiangensis]
MNGAWWAAVVQWRNWPLLVKLGVVLVVPVVGALVLGVLRVYQDVRLAESYRDIERVAALRVDLGHTLTAVQLERTEAARGGPNMALLAETTDAAIDRTRDTLGRAPELAEEVSLRYRAMTGTLGLLDYTRDRMINGGDRTVILNAYNAVTQAILDFDRALVGRFPDEQLTGTSIALNELQGMREQIGVQHATGLLGLADGQLTAVEGAPIVEAELRLDDNLGDFEAVAPPAMVGRYGRTVTGSALADRRVMTDAVRAGTARFDTDQWHASLSTSGDLMRQVSEDEARRLRAESGRLAEYISNRAGAESVLLLTLVLLAAGIGGGLGRYLVRSFGTLRRTALEVAATRLPEAVAAIRAGDTGQAAIQPVPLRTTEEFGQLARAFDAVHSQAVRSAADEANLRRDLSNIFQNLSRRSQGLVERQLRQLEALEQKADDPDQLANLFRIDHLATRMRRNNENLMVLSGATLSRRFTEPVPLSDVLRAAVSEVEQYQRALIRSAPGLRIVGYAAGDLIRSAAELIENATTFSPPQSQVVIESTERADGSLRVEILDQGVGMGDAELRTANERVAAGGGAGVPISRQMGLFVVGRLTARHGITVALGRREGAGLCAAVTVPATLVTHDEQPVPALTAHAGPVADRLELAGIHVRLPEFPSARTPASILFTAHTPVDSPAPAAGGFTWLRGPAGAPGVAPVAPAAAPVALGPNGLPKRVPKGQLLAPPAPPVAPPSGGAPARDPARARGFLSAFQAGVRDGQNQKGEA